MAGITVDNVNLEALCSDADRARIACGVQESVPVDVVVNVCNHVRKLAGGIERLWMYRESSEKLIGVCSHVHDVMARHFNADGSLRGDGQWRLDEIGKAFREMDMAFDEAAEACDLRNEIADKNRWPLIGIAAEKNVEDGNVPTILLSR